MAEASSATLSFGFLADLRVDIILHHTSNIGEQTLNNYTLIHTLKGAEVEQGKDRDSSHSSRVCES